MKKNKSIIVIAVALLLSVFCSSCVINFDGFNDYAKEDVYTGCMTMTEFRNLNHGKNLNPDDFSWDEYSNAEYSSIDFRSMNHNRKDRYEITTYIQKTLGVNYNSSWEKAGWMLRNDKHCIVYARVGEFVYYIIK